MSQSIPTGYIPPGSSRGLAQKTCPGGRDLTFESCPGLCGKWKWNFKKIAWIKFLEVKTKTSRIFDLFRGLRVLSMEFFLVYGSIIWFCYHSYLTKNLRSCPFLVHFWSFHWVMVIHTYFCTKGCDYVKRFVRVLVLLVINTGCPKNLLKMGNTAL